jgi:hypothetical protein
VSLQRADGDPGESEPEELPPVFTREGDGFIPSAYACSPWSEDQQHGAVMLGLLARAVERHPGDVPRQVTRLTVDMMRAAPMARVEVHCRAVRTGRWVETLEARLSSGGEEYARATAMRFRLQALDTRAARADAQPRAARDASVAWHLPRRIRFFARCVEMNPGDGARGRMVWYRMRVPLVAGEPTSGLQRAAALSDFTYGTPRVLLAHTAAAYAPDPEVSSINPDTTLNLLREPQGEWIGLESELVLGDLGAGVATATLWDETGVVGSVTQSVLLRPVGAQNRVGWRSQRRG